LRSCADKVVLFHTQHILSLLSYCFSIDK
jgi:hypothetical protein